MNVHELDRRLKEEGVNPRFYIIGNATPADQWVIKQEANRKWPVFYGERDYRLDEKFFHSEEEVSQYFYRLVISEPDAFWRPTDGAN